MSYDIAYMWNLKKKDTNEIIYKIEVDRQKTYLWLPKWGRGRLGVWD